MLYTRETKKIKKLKRSVAISYLIIFFLIIWIIRKYDDEDIYFDRSNNYYLENIEKEDQINKLHKEIESLRKSNIKENIILDKPKNKSEKNKSEKNKEYPIIKIDSVPTKIEIDTLKK